MIDLPEQVKLLDVHLGDINWQHMPISNPTNPLKQAGDGPLVFINNAATIEPIEKFTDVTTDNFELSMRVNCFSPLALAQLLIRKTCNQNRRLFIFNISTDAALRPVQGWLAYCASKAAFKMALDVLAIENRLVQVLHFDPGLMDTPMQRIIRQQQELKMPGVATFRDYLSQETWQLN